MLLYNNTQAERDRAHRFADVHHLTSFPDSLKENVKITMEYLEKQVQGKINQLTYRDTERYLLLLRLFKRASPNGILRIHEGEHYILRDEFLRVLQALGITATMQQATALFDRYDKNRNGQLTVQEFLVLFAAPHFTHPWRHCVPPPEMKPPGPAQGGPPLRPVTPPCEWSMDDFFAQIRDKMRINNPSPFTLSVPRCRRNLGQLFESVDRRFERTVNAAGLKRVLDLLNFPISRHHLALLLQEFPVPNSTGLVLFDYPRFIRYCYPDDHSSTSLFMEYDKEFVKQGYHTGNIKRETFQRGMTPPSAERSKTPVYAGRRATPQTARRPRPPSGPTRGSRTSR